MVDDGTFLGFLGFEPSISAMALVAVVVLYMHCSVGLPNLCTQNVLNSAEIKCKVFTVRCVSA